MTLYYDNTNNSFSLNKTSTCECVFETYDRNKRVGWKKGHNPIIKKGPYEISIKTNFYTTYPTREKLIVNIVVNGVLLLPLSKACRKAAILYHFNKHQIAFLQYGAGNNAGRVPATIVQLRDKISWKDAIEDICNICNNYQNWIVSETEMLLSSLVEHKKTSFNDIATLLDLVQVYDKIVPSIIPVYKDFIDSRGIEAMQELLDYIKTRVNDNNLKEDDKNAKKRNGDIIWKYIKDFYIER